MYLKCTIFGWSHLDDSLLKGRELDVLKDPLARRGPERLGFRVQGSGFRVQGSGCRVQGSGFRVQGSRFRVQGAGFRVQCSGLKEPRVRRGPEHLGFRVWVGGGGFSI